METVGGVRLARFNLADRAGWLDCFTVRLLLTLTNLSSTAALTPICISPATMFRRVRVIANGLATLADIEEHDRVFQASSELLPPQRRFANMSEAWGSPSTVCRLPTPDPSDPIPKSGARTVCVCVCN